MAIIRLTKEPILWPKKKANKNTIYGYNLDFKANFALSFGQKFKTNIL
jgi:hypothetical protein